MIYVDDLILLSPEKHEAGIWKELDTHILFKDPAAPLTRFLRVNHAFSKLPDGTCQMLTEGKEYLEHAAAEYMKEIGVQTLEWVLSPTIEDKFDKSFAKRGKQASTALSQLMKIMYLGRLFRADVLTTTTFLARRIHFWSSNEDCRLHRLHVIHISSCGLMPGSPSRQGRCVPRLLP